LSNWRKNWLWSPLATLWAILTVPLTVLSILLAAPFLGPRRAFWTLGPLWAQTMFRVFGVEHRILGWEELPEEIRRERQSVVFMSNHESNLDPPVLIGSIPVPAVFLAKKEVKYMGPVGWAAMAAGVIFIDRSNGERAARSLRRAAQEIRDGKNVVIFPEGTRTRTGRMNSFKKGGFSLAQKAGVPIVPLATVGGFRMLPPGGCLVRPGSYTVVFGQPIDPKVFTSREALMDEVRARITELRQRALAGEAREA
jgi:1-acyl-sn-glycerol-3-phosphate acyltransferase